MQKKINVENLEGPHPKSLGIASVKKLRDLFNTQHNTQYKTISQVAKHLGTNNLQAQYDLSTTYNTEVERQQTFNRTLKSAYKTIVRTLPTTATKLFITTPKPEKVKNRFGFDDHSYHFDQPPDTVTLAKLNQKYGPMYGAETYLERDKFRTVTSTALLKGGEPILRNIYDKLMIHKNHFNRITITTFEIDEHGVKKEYKVGSSKLQQDITFEAFLKIWGELQQSEPGNDIFKNTYTIQTRALPAGAGRMRPNAELPAFLIKQGINAISVKENCAFFCFALADCKNSESKHMRTPARFARWEAKALAIKKEMGIESISMTFPEAEIYANLRKRQVVILSDNFIEVYKTEHFYGADIVYLYYDKEEEHYHFINDINSATNDSKRNRKWCGCCNKSYLRINFVGHKCTETVCGLCKVDFHTEECKLLHYDKKWAQCETCNVWCANPPCLENHQKLCKGTVMKCGKCKKWIKKEHYAEHSCGEVLCKACDKYHNDENHRCCIPIQKLTEIKKMDTIVYDFESEFLEGGVHRVNFAYAEKLFSDDVKEFFDDIEEFVKYALKQKNTTFVAHNGKAYDTWLVHKYLIKHTSKRPSTLILAGNKIMYMKIGSIRFVDSLNHIAQPLASFPETFGLTELKKGFFPYIFNTPANQAYVGEIPHIKYFTPNEMKPEKRAEFLIWYKSHFDDGKYTAPVYNFRDELRNYCISDVHILKQALEVYVTDNIRENKINPLSCATIASFDMKVYRTQHYDGNIAVLKKDEYDWCKKGFYGGRTEVFRHKVQFTEDQIKRGYFGVYKDICSLYPTVQFYDELPCGIPVLTIDPVYDDVERFLLDNFGYCECDVICPKDKKVIPLLPERKDGKLIFDMVNKYNVIYTTAELLKAIQIGYTITIHKSLKFEKSRDLFKSYIRKFLKIKAEAGGYKGDNLNEYIAKYAELGIELDKDNVKANKGLKLLAKNMLNNLWGKFGQKDCLPTSEYLKPDQWYRLLQKHKDGKIELKNETLIDDDCVYVQYINKESDNTSLLSTNVALAGFVTSQARLRLYEQLELIGKDRLIYCDTDSIVYINSPDGYNIPSGDMLGEWEDECATKEHKSNPITNFLAISPKSYGYTTLYGDGDIKCKGITLSYENSRKYTMESIDDLITGKKDSINTRKMMFNKDKKKGEIRTEYMQKDIQFDRTTTKSNVLPDFTTEPFRQTDALEKMLLKRIG